MKKVLYILLMFIFTSPLSGCWNYREIEKMAIVAGVAIDKGKDGKIDVTAEVINISSGEKGGEINPIYIEMDGNTFFEAVRGAVSISGKKLYWGHTKVAILSKDIASKDVDRVLDFLMRDSEIREDMWLVISKDNTAKEILQGKTLLEKILSFELDNALRSQKIVSRFPSVEIYKFTNKITGNSDTGFAPAVKNVETKKGKTFQVVGSGIFKKNNLTGWLDKMESKLLLWIRNELKGGVFVVNEVAGTDTNVTLEIIRSKTEVKPHIFEGRIEFDISINPTVNIGELEGSGDFISEKGREVLRKEAEKDIKKGVEELIRKVQKEYNTDIFGFGRKLQTHYPKAWNEIKDNWDERFPEVETKVNVNLQISGSATNKKPIMTGE